MKILYSWLKDYVDFSQSPEQLADDLSMFAHEVESIEKIGDDAILDLEITPNRGDCLSHLGIARQIAAMYDLKVKGQKSKVKIKEENVDKNINITISDPRICPRYSARIIDNIKIKSSPEWIQKRLKSYGFRPINNVVDITNYVMIATGQPMHAFDFDKILSGKINIHLSKKGNEVMTLDGKNQVLPDNAIIISDDKKIYDLAGIMGGYKSEVDPNTKTIVLQCALFDPVLIRRTSKYLHHTTDASYRYERGVDPEGTVSAVDFATALIKKILPDAKLGKLIDYMQVKFEKPKISYSYDRINKLIGTNLGRVKISNYLQRSFFKVADDVAEVPSFRFYDISIWQDLAEEVARIYGYNNITRIKPNIETAKTNSDWQKRESIKDVLKDIGFNEIYSYSFCDKEKLELLGYNIANCIEIKNPLSPETQYLRPSLLPSILNAVSKNPWAPEINIFELEKVFNKNLEKWQLGLATIEKNDILIKKALNAVGEKVEIIDVDKKILDAYKIRRPLKITLIDLDKINIKNSDISYDVSQNNYRPISKYPPTIRDIAFIVETNIEADEIKKTILVVSGAIILTEVFDEFVSEKFGLNKKNVALHIWLQNIHGPVSDNDADKIIKNVIKKIENKFQAKLRS